MVDMSGLTTGGPCALRAWTAMRWSLVYHRKSSASWVHGERNALVRLSPELARRGLRLIVIGGDAELLHVPLATPSEARAWAEVLLVSTPHQPRAMPAAPSADRMVLLLDQARIVRARTAYRIAERSPSAAEEVRNHVRQLLRVVDARRPPLMSPPIEQNRGCARRSRRVARPGTSTTRRPDQRHPNLNERAGGRT